MRRCLKAASFILFSASLQSTAFAQVSALGGGEIRGVVRDISGAVLADVTVEVSSSALIEKVRSSATDHSGSYAITGLRPGTYTVVFSRTGFARTVVDDIGITGTVVRTANATMTLGNVTDAIVVTNEPRLIEIDGTVHQRVFVQDVIDRLPISRSFYSLPVLIPAVNSSTRDVGNASGNVFNTTETAHGGRGEDQRVVVGGLGVGTTSNPGVSNFAPNPEAASEIVIEIGASSAETQSGGVIMNYVPRNGGNTFHGSAFLTAAGARMQSRNLTPDLVTLGAGPLADTLEKTWEVNPGLGGPFVRDRLWLYGSARRMVVQTRTNQFYNQHAFQPDVWAYVADPNRPARSKDGQWSDYQARVTWQITGRNTFAWTFDSQTKCECPAFVSSTRAPEAGANDRNPVQRTVQIEYRSPFSNTFMVEFVGQTRAIEQSFAPLTLETSGAAADVFEAYRRAVGVTIINGRGVVPDNFIYHGPGPTSNQNPNVGGPFTDAERPAYAYHLSSTYQTAKQTFKVGIQDVFGHFSQRTYSITVDAGGRPYPVRYEFSMPDTPRAVIVYSGIPDAPSSVRNDLDHDMGVYLQDRMSMKRLTVNGGLRFDWFQSTYPQQTLPATAYGRPAATFAAGTNLDWKDVTPRLGLSWAPFEKGTTAVKFTLNKYVQSLGLGGIGLSANPLAVGRGVVNNFRRNWSDADSDFVVDCDLYAPAPNGECTNAIGEGVLKPLPNPLIDSAVREGWGVRPFNWELSLGVQRELWPGTAIEMSYFRRSFANFLATDDAACVNVADGIGCREARNYRRFDIVAPIDSRLPGGGGYMLAGFVEPDCTGAANCGGADLSGQMAALAAVNQTVRMKDIGAHQIDKWNGVDVSLNVRRSRLILLGGTSTGRRHTDECEVWRVLPEVQGPGRPYSACKILEPFRTSVKGLAAYTIPRLDMFPHLLAAMLEDIQLGWTFQSIPGGEMAANYDMTNEEFARACPSGLADTSCSTLGRFLANQTQPTNTRNVSLLLPGTLYDMRHNQVDLRIGKRLRFRTTRLGLNVDLFNVFNASPVLARNSTLNQSPAPGSYSAAQQQQADGGFNSLWVPTSVLQPRFLKFSMTIDF